MVSLKKQSKKLQREFYSSQRGSWNGISPVTRIATAKKGGSYNRAQEKQRAQREV